MINFSVGIALVREFSIFGVAIATIFAQFGIFALSSIVQIRNKAASTNTVLVDLITGILATIALISMAIGEENIFKSAIKAFWKDSRFTNLVSVLKNEDTFFMNKVYQEE